MTDKLHMLDGRTVMTNGDGLVTVECMFGDEKIACTDVSSDLACAKVLEKCAKMLRALDWQKRRVPQ